MLEKLAQRREMLIRQKRDVDHALEEVERLAADAEATLRGIQTAGRKLGSG
jgi:chaperonin cofactor prefoldin